LYILEASDENCVGFKNNYNLIWFLANLFKG